MKKILMTVCAAAAMTAAAGENLLKNAGFGQTDGAGNPEGWVVNSPDVWKVVKGAGINGSAAMMFDCDDPKKKRTGPFQYVKLEPGRKYIYRVKVRHEGLHGNIRNSGGVQICLDGVDRNGKRTCGRYSHGMGGTWKDWYEIREFMMDVPENTKTAAFRLGVWSGLSGKAWFCDPVVEEYVPPVVESLATSAYRDRSWQGAVRLAAALNIPKDGVKDHTGFFLYKDAGGRDVRVKADRMDAETAFLKLDTSRFAMGAQTLKFELVKDGRTVATAERKFERLAERPAEYKVWFDEHGRWIVDGRPFFPMSVSVKSISPEKLPPVLDLGMNAVQCGSNPSDEMWEWCRKNNLKIMRSIGNLYYGERWTVKRGWKSYEDQFNHLTNRIHQAKDRPGLLCWVLNDEPRPALKPKMLRQQDLFETFDPGHPTRSVFDHPEYVRGFIGTFDECCLDPYPLGRWPVSSVSEWMNGIKGGATGVKPVGAVLQAFDWMWFRMGRNMETPHFPTFGELRCMTWQAIACGASSLRYYGFNHFDRDAANYDRNFSIFKRVTTDVRKFMPVLLSVEEPVKVTVPRKSRLLTRAWRMDGDSYVLVVNALGEGARAELRLSENFGQGSAVMGEGVSFGDDDKLTVEMEPLGCALMRLR